MVLAYLEKIRERFYEERIVAYNRLHAANNEYRENVEIIKLLEENRDPTFEAFTPRTVTGFNKMKIEELNSRQKELEVDIVEMKKRVTNIEDEIDEINQVIKHAKDMEKNI